MRQSARVAVIVANRSGVATQRRLLTVKTTTKFAPKIENLLDDARLASTMPQHRAKAVHHSGLQKMTLSQPGERTVSGI